MKRTKFAKGFFLFFVLISILSCKDDNNDSKLTTDLVGEWQRSDFSDEFEYKLVFISNNTGYSSQLEGAKGGPQISTAKSFNWAISDTKLNIDYDGDIVTTNFSFNTEGQLLLSDLTDLYFVKLK